MSSPAELQKTLDGLGLGFLFPILNRIVTDPSIDSNDEDAVAKYIEADTTSQDAIKKRFVGNEGRVKAGLQPLTPKQYIAAEQTYADTLKNNGLPQGFYDQPDDFQKLIAGNVSAVEFNNRIQQGYMAAKSAPQAVKDQLSNLYGITDQDLAAYFLDPTKATDVIKAKEKNAFTFNRQIQAAQISAQGKTQAGIQLGMGTAEELAAQGITADQAQQGFQQIGTTQELYNPLQGEQVITQEQQIAGTFGTNAEARKAITARKRSRQAAFETGGGFATTQGASALGTVGQ
jgi:hypothetical protein